MYPSVGGGLDPQQRGPQHRPSGGGKVLNSVIPMVEWVHEQISFCIIVFDGDHSVNSVVSQLTYPP